MSTVCPLSLSAGSITTITLSLTITTSHEEWTSASCISLTSVGGEAAIIASSQRSGSLQTGRGLLTSTFTSRTGPPSLSRPTGHWRGRLCPRRHDRCLVEGSTLQNPNERELCIFSGPKTECEDKDNLT